MHAPIESSAILTGQVRQLEDRITVASSRAKAGLFLVGLLGVLLVAGNHWPPGVRLAIGLALFMGAVITLAFLLQLGDLAHRTREITTMLARGLESVVEPLPPDSGQVTLPLPATLEEHALTVWNRVKKEIDRRQRLSADLDRRVFEATTLYDLMLRMSEDLKLDAALKLALYSSMGVFGVTEGLVLLEEDGQLVPSTVRVVSEPTDAKLALDDAAHGALRGLSRPLPWTELEKQAALIPFTSHLARAYPGFRPAAACPLAIHGQFVGLMLLGPKVTKEAFSSENFRLLETIAPAVALVVKNTRMVSSLERTNAQLDRKVQELELLNDISKNLNTAGELSDVLVTVLDQAARGVECTSGALHLFDPATGSLQRVALSGPFAALAGAAPVPLGTGLLGAVGQSLKPLRVGPGHPFGPEELGFAAGSDIHSILAVPLSLERRLVGLLTMVNKTQDRAFTESDQSWMQTVANHTASVMENLRLFRLATEDGLTGLYVHRYFQIRLREELSRAVRHGRPLALVLCDIDHFKEVNDTHGHQTGDVVLREVSRILRNSLRDVDVAARYGGEEMAIILPETDAAGAKIVAERIRVAIETQTYPAGATQIHVTASFGIGTVSPTAGARPGRDALEPMAQELVERTDQALYAAKRAGRNRVELASR